MFNAIKKNFLLFNTLLCLRANAEGVLTSWSQNDLIGMTRDKFDNAKKWKTSDILTMNVTVTTWPDIYLLLVASMQYKDDKKFIQGLIGQITDGKEANLQLTKRLVILDRIANGDILFEGKGMQIDDDLFKVGGRANFILRNITKHNFGLISLTSIANELSVLQNKWAAFAEGKNVEEYVNPYKSTDKGLTEIQSLSALKALIVSLKPSIEKDALTKSCLKNVYQLDEMPKERGTSASYCNPDTYTFAYLGILTGEKKYDEKKDYAWWQKWWEDNKDRLTWNKEKAIFEIVNNN
jgi:hypothetical protein